MRVSIPVRYTVTGVEFRHREPSKPSMIENVWVDVPDVPAADLDLALVIRAPDGMVVENVYGYAGKTWVRNDRRADDLPMVSQHLPLAGRKVPSVQGGRVQDQKDAIARLARQIEAVGVLGMITGDVGYRAYEELAYRDDDGLKFLERTPESERMRSVTESERAMKFAVAETAAANDTIAVDGVLYCRVNEPTVLVDCSYSMDVRWRFGSPDFFSTDRTYQNRSLYGVSVRDFERLTEWFGEGMTLPKVGFSMEVLDDRYFLRRNDRIALLADANRIIDEGVTRTSGTEYVMRWCALRDTYERMWSAEEGRLKMPQVVDGPEEDFERLCELCEAAVAESNSRYDRKGLTIWNSRTMEVPNLTPSVRVPKL